MKRCASLAVLGPIAAAIGWGIVAPYIRAETPFPGAVESPPANSSWTPSWVPRDVVSPSPIPRLAQREQRPATPPTEARDAKSQVSEPSSPAASTSVPAQGETTGGALALADLEQMALECNPTLVQAAMQIRAAQGECVQEGLYPNPKVAYIGDEIGSGGSAGFQGFFVTQEIVTAGKRRLGQSVAGHDAEAAQQAWEVQRRRVLNDVRAAYYDALLAQRTIEISEQLQRISEEGLETTEKLRKAQEVSEANVLEAQIESDTARLDVMTARNRYWAVWRRLAAVVGRPEMEPVRLAGSPEEVPPPLQWEVIFAQLLSQSPELSQARAAVEKARCEAARQYAERVPNFEVGAGARYDTGAREMVADVSVSVPIPIFNRNQGNILKAQAELVAAQNEVRRVELDLHDRLASVFEHYVNSRQRVDAYLERILPKARKSLDLIGTGYRQGEFDYLTLLTAQRTYFNAVLNYVKNLRDLHNHWVDLEGLLLRGGLQQVGQTAPPIE